MTPEEFDEFYTTSFSRLVGQLHALTGDWAEAQDVVQEAFIRAWDRRESFELANAPEAWIRTVAWRLAVSRLRRIRRGIQLLHHFHTETHVDPPTDERPMLVAALRLLSDQQRRAIVLHHLCDLSVEQVATETGSSVSTVKARLSRGRSALARTLRETASHHEREDTRA